MLFSNASISAVATLPQDIIVETLISVLVVSIGLVLGADKLKPISWRDWAGEIERDGGARNPYVGLEERYNFWDIRVSQLSRDINADAQLPLYWYTVQTFTLSGELTKLDIRPSERSLRIGFADQT